MLYENYPKFLDSILKAFSEDYNKELSLNDLKSVVFKNYLNKGYSLGDLDKNLEILVKETFTYSDYLIYGLNFLEKEELIIYDKSKTDRTKSINITSKGFNKIKTEGFEEKILNDKKVIKLQKDTLITAKFSLIVSVIALIITTYFSIKTNETENCNNFSKISSSHNHKTCKPTNVSQTQKQTSIKSLKK